MSGPTNGDGHRNRPSGRRPASARHARRGSGNVPSNGKARPVRRRRGVRPWPRRGGHGRGPARGMTMPVEKPKDFRGTLLRLIGELRPERPRIVLVVVVAFLSMAGQVFGPKILGNGINQLMNGLVGKELGQYMPAGTTHAQAVAILQARLTARWPTWWPGPTQSPASASISAPWAWSCSV